MPDRAIVYFDPAEQCLVIDLIAVSRRLFDAVQPDPLLGVRHSTDLETNDPTWSMTVSNQMKVRVHLHTYTPPTNDENTTAYLDMHNGVQDRG
jgi:hypothetical protein